MIRYWVMQHTKNHAQPKRWQEPMKVSWHKTPHNAWKRMREVAGLDDGYYTILANRRKITVNEKKRTIEMDSRSWDGVDFTRKWFIKKEKPRH